MQLNIIFQINVMQAGVCDKKRMHVKQIVSALLAIHENLFANE